MKRWGFLVTALYFLTLILLSLPVTLAAFWKPNSPNSDISNIMEMYLVWPFWVWMFIMICGELLLLFVPIRYSERRPKSRRPLLVPIITSSLFLGILVFCGVLSLLAGIWGDEGPSFMTNTPESVVAICFCLIPIFSWIVWGIIFYRRTKTEDPDALIRRATSWLLKGSILELLIAIPCHIAARRRDDCCAPLGTFLGIAAGISIMLMAFGPGTFFLFKERLKRLKPAER